MPRRRRTSIPRLLCLEDRIAPASGDLDLSFAGTGIKEVTVGTSAPVAALTLQPDGKILVAGSHQSGPDCSNFAVIRLDSDGSLDTTFGDSGKVQFDVAGGDDGAAAILLLSDGK